MGVKPEQLRDLMRHWPSGVSIVSSEDDTSAHGMTVSSFTSISLDPPLVLVSLERGTRTHQLVTRRGAFAISILSESQADLAERFAGRVKDEDNRGHELRDRSLPSQLPIPLQRLAYLDCQVVRKVEAGTHTIFIGEVLGAEPSSEAPPLLYYSRQYRTLAD